MTDLQDGPLPPNWQRVAMQQICTPSDGIQTGPFGSQLHASDYVPYGVPLVMPVNIGDNRLVERGIASVRAADAERLARHRLTVGDIVMSRRGDVERRALVRHANKGWLCGTGCLRIRVSPRAADAEYVSFYLSHPLVRGWITRHAVGATMPNLNVDIVARVPVVLPPLPEQRAIASILGALDDKIDLNRRMSETLEAMARALFNSWFVDFDPVRAKTEGRDPGLPKEIADLFPDRLVDSELGEIPEGWRVAALREEFEAAKGLSYKGSGLADSGLPLHNLNSIYEGGGYKHSGVKWYRGEYANRHLVRGGDVIVANTEQGHDRRLIGFAARIPNEFSGLGLFSHHLYRLRPTLSSRLSGNWICRLLNTRVMHETVSGYANGTTVNMLPIDGLQSPRVVVPSSQLVTLFDRHDDACQARRDQAVQQMRNLSTLRDTLLPKLISGELRIPDPERFLKEVAA